MEYGLAIILAASCALAFVIFGRASERNRRFEEDVKKAPSRIAEGMKDDSWAKPEKRLATASLSNEPAEPQDEFDFFAESDDKAAIQAIAKGCSQMSLDGWVKAKFNVADTEVTLIAHKGRVANTMFGSIDGQYVPSEVTFTARLGKPASQSFTIQPKLELDVVFPVESPWPDFALDLVEGPWEAYLKELCASVPVDDIFISFDSLEFKISVKGVLPTKNSLEPFVLTCTAMTRHLLRALAQENDNDSSNQD